MSSLHAEQYIMSLGSILVSVYLPENEDLVPTSYI